MCGRRAAHFGDSLTDSDFHLRSPFSPRVSVLQQRHLPNSWPVMSSPIDTSGCMYGQLFADSPNDHMIFVRTLSSGHACCTQLVHNATTGGICVRKVLCEPRSAAGADTAAREFDRDVRIASRLLAVAAKKGHEVRIPSSSPPPPRPPSLPRRSRTGIFVTAAPSSPSSPGARRPARPSRSAWPCTSSSRRSRRWSSCTRHPSTRSSTRTCT